jgi:UDP-glucoronosyl and UDP-glucosyl transferase
MTALLVFQRVVWKVSNRDLSNDFRRSFDAVVTTAGEPSCCYPARPVSDTRNLHQALVATYKTCTRLPWSPHHDVKTCIVTYAGNIHVQQWLPQQDLLGHPAVKLFLSHGGIHSIYEALYHSTPMVLLPIATDQFDNAR